MAAKKTYKIGLYLKARQLYNYMTKWQQKLQDTSSEEQFDSFTATFATLNELLGRYQPEPPDLDA